MSGLYCWLLVSLLHVWHVLLVSNLPDLSVSCKVCSVNQQSACFMLVCFSDQQSLCFMSGLFCWCVVSQFLVCSVDQQCLCFMSGLFCKSAICLFHVWSAGLLCKSAICLSCQVCSVNQQSACHFYVRSVLLMSSISISCLVCCINQISVLESSSESSEQNEMWRFLTPFQLQGF